jgi:two-component sensor histidine kinase
VLAQLAPRLNDRADGTDPDLVRVASGVQAGRVELEHGDATLQLESVPLTSSGQRRGALILVRDVTELRHRERALMTKEASLREVHHRIKNNLQMVAALLRMQSRRVSSDEARGALVDAGTRIGAIAVVHEVLAASPESTVDFDDVIDRVLVMAGELAPDARVRREGSIGMWPTETATPMAMCLAELVANAVEHSGASPRVNVSVRRSGESARVRVDDNGPGLPADFAPQSSGRLGLQIVQTLVTENGGTVEWCNRSGGGASVVLEFRNSVAGPKSANAR